VTLPWWALVYLVGYAAVGIAASRDDYRKGRGLWAVGELLATALGVLFVVALWYPGLQAQMGKAVVPLFVGALVWEVVSAAHDLAHVEPDPELPAATDRFAQRLGVVLAAMLVTPALAAGALLSWGAIIGPAA
jgi:hypothetical protein